MSADEENAIAWFKYLQETRQKQVRQQAWVGTNTFDAIDTVLNLIKKQQEEIKPIRELKIPVETLVAEFNRLEDLEDDRDMLKAEIEKKDKQLQEKDNIIKKLNLEAQKYFEETIHRNTVIDLMAKEIGVLCTGITVVRESFERQYCEFITSDEDCCWKTDKDCSQCIIEYFTNKVEGGNK